ncbi:MAG: cbb3-type cytochrome oxidase assembly protein CcoS [Phycisphaera sp.]|nr:MAG: cbb3-type cytochrome oxidase assembly protein CcoS [Phycisphaera sp.]
MSVLWIVIPLAFIFAGVAVWAFVWTVRSGQMDDLDTPASRILIEDEDLAPAEPKLNPTRENQD